MNELTAEEKARLPETWKAMVHKRMIHALVSGILLGVGFVVTVISVAMFTKGG